MAALIHPVSGQSYSAMVINDTNKDIQMLTLEGRIDSIDLYIDFGALQIGWHHSNPENCKSIYCMYG